jgi:glyoxylase-like metal-dependent hydrolase (beta-lactamase superfamily II)/8-oxo-dGTP pyrophosphatase MutT (NUDIX family)
MLRRSPDDPSSPVQPRPAATIVLVRPGPDGLEVLLTRRPDSMAFAAGLHVFPGGRVEPADADPRLVGRATGAVDDPDFQVAHRIAAIRETWEEVGVLLAETSAPPRPGSSFLALAEDRDLTLHTDDLVEVARWTTPRAFPRRFDALFFAAQLPPGAVLTPDASEVAAHEWLTPRAALAAMAAGAIGLWPPTSTTLQRLERAPSFDEIRAGLFRAAEAPVRIEQVDPGLRVMTGPGAFGPGGRPANTVLVGRREVVVVDPGDPGEAFLDALEAEATSGGGRIVAIALTHVDPGHAAGSEDLRARTDAPIYAGPGAGAPLSWPVAEIDEGAIVAASSESALTAIATQGHRPDHLSFLTRDGTLIAGDALTDRPTLILPPEGDPDAQRSTLERIDALVAEGRIRRIVPGHGPALLPVPTAH